MVKEILYTYLKTNSNIVSLPDDLQLKQMFYN